MLRRSLKFVSMRTLLPWAAAAVCLTAFGLSYVHGKRLEAQLHTATHPLYHRHADVRQFFIRAALDGAPSPIIILGDSITEGAPLPASACGHPLINAGIGGAATPDFIQLAPTLFDGRPRPHLIVVALGANDVHASHLVEDYRDLLARIGTYTANVIAVSNTADADVLAAEKIAAASVGVPFLQIDVTGLMSDQIHFNAVGYQQWVPAIIDAACRRYARAAP